MKTGSLITNLAPTLLQIPSLIYCPHNLTKYEGKHNSKIPIFLLFSEMGRNLEAELTYKNLNIPSFMNWKVLRSPTTATNLNFQSFYELGKSLKYSLRPTFKNPNFKSKDELSSTVENKGNLHKIWLVT